MTTKEELIGHVDDLATTCEAKIKALSRIKQIIENVEHRCLAADGPVTPTHQEISHDELCAIYALANGQPETWRAA